MRPVTKKWTLAAILPLAGACGLTAIGEMALEEVPRPDARDGSSDAYFDTSDLDDGSLEAGDGAARALCLERCDGGCDGSICVLECPAKNSCPGIVVCPADVPCDVACSGPESCAAGIDCTQASSCSLRCTGNNSCKDAPVVCGGSTCSVACAGPGTSCDRGVLCDAGACGIYCQGDDCKSGPVQCHARDCTIHCGNDAGGGAAGDTCKGGVLCEAESSCTIDCFGTKTCNDVAVVAVAKETASIECGRDTCNQGAVVSARDGGISCGRNACGGQGVFCDGGQCTLACDDDNGDTIGGCCSAATCLDAGTNNGSFNLVCP